LGASYRAPPGVRDARSAIFIGANRFRGSGHDIDIYPFGREDAPLVFEVKARKMTRK
jgi:hypothetical protein